jgi:hypothetical protein
LEEKIMANEYITDPDLLEQLNAPAKKEKDEGYVTDPELLRQLGTPSAVQEMLTAPPTGVENMAVVAAGAARPMAQAYWEGPARGGVRDMASVAENLKNISPEGAAEILKNPYLAAKAYVQGHPWATSIKNIPSNVAGFAGRAAGGVLTAPENLALLPYNMAAYEQEKIRANPSAPEYATNPYAMQYRGEAPTQAAAGAMNQRRAVQQYSTQGNPAPGTPEFQQMQQQYQPSWIDTAMQNFQRYRGVIGQ